MGLLDKIKGLTGNLPAETPELIQKIDNFRIDFGVPLEFYVTGVDAKVRESTVYKQPMQIQYYTIGRQVKTSFQHRSGGTWNVTSDLSFELPCNPGQDLKVGDKVMLLAIPIDKDEDVLPED